MKLFRKTGWIYLPTSISGAIISLGALAANIWFFVVLDRNSHSASDTLITLLPFMVSIWVIYGFIASNCSEKGQKFKKNEKINNNASRKLRNGDGIDSYGGTLFILAGYFFNGLS